MSAPTDPGGLTGIKDIARVLGVSKQRADQIANAGSFPAPYDDLGPGRGRIWLTEKIRPHLDRIIAERAARASRASDESDAA